MNHTWSKNKGFQNLETMSEISNKQDSIFMSPDKPIRNFDGIEVLICTFRSHFTIEIQKLRSCSVIRNFDLS